MAFGASLAVEMGWLPPGDRDRIVNLCRAVGLAVYHPILTNLELMLEGQKNMRRKRGDGGLWAPLPTGIGTCDYAQEVPPALLAQAIAAHRDYCAQFADGGAGCEMYLSDLGLA